MTQNLRDIKEHIYKVFARCNAIPKNADIVLRDLDGWQTTIECTWKPAMQTELGGAKDSRQITLQLTGVVTKLFLEASEERLLHMDSTLSNIVQNRILQGYKETDSDTGPFIIGLDGNDFES